MLDTLSRTAASTPRLRKNLNLHASEQDPVQQFFNAIQPGSYVQPHRHLAAGREETILMMQGEMGLVFFDDAGQVTHLHRLAPGTPHFGVQIPLGAWHSVCALRPDTVFFEIKQGPYCALSPEEFASWAPAPGSAGADGYLGWMESLFSTPPPAVA